MGGIWPASFSVIMLFTLDSESLSPGSNPGPAATSKRSICSTNVSSTKQAEFGHKDIKITMDTYTHYLPTMQGPYVARLDELFGEWADRESD